jgi:hypothetical protein
VIFGVRRLVSFGRKGSAATAKDTNSQGHRAKAKTESDQAVEAMGWHGQFSGNNDGRFAVND